jgi:hypothetical protein
MRASGIACRTAANVFARLTVGDLSQARALGPQRLDDRQDARGELIGCGPAAPARRQPRVVGRGPRAEASGAGHDRKTKPASRTSRGGLFRQCDGGGGRGAAPFVARNVLHGAASLSSLRRDGPPGGGWPSKRPATGLLSQRLVKGPLTSYGARLDQARREHQRRDHPHWRGRQASSVIRIAVSQAAFEAIAAAESDALWAR